MRFFEPSTRVRFRCECGQTETIRIANMPYTPGGQFVVGYDRVQCPRCLRMVEGTIREEDADFVEGEQE